MSIIVALLVALIYIVIIGAIASLASYAVSRFLVPINSDAAYFARILIGLFAFIGVILVLIQVFTGGLNMPHLT